MAKKIIDGEGDVVLTNSLFVEQNLETGANLTVGGDLTELSSIAYKTNVQQLHNCLSLIEKLSGVSYEKKNQKGRVHSGLIAEDVAKIIPEVVSYQDGRVHGVQYTRIIAYLIEAIKELSQEVKSLKEK